MFWYSLKIISLMKDSPHTIRSLVMYTQTHMHHLSIAQLLEKNQQIVFIICLYYVHLFILRTNHPCLLHVHL